MVRKNWAFAAAPVLGIILTLTLVPAYGPQFRAEAYVAVMVLLAADLALIGWLVNGRPMGAFIDNRNRISLSKLQAGAWTIVVLSGFATAAAWNVAAEIYQASSVTALSIVIPGQLLLAMGISATSLVATPALLSIKSNEAPEPAAEGKAQVKLGIAVSGNGKVLTKGAAGDASWGDLFTGDELGNAGSPDLGKIQQVLVTLLLLGCYLAYVYADLDGSAETIRSLPAVDQSFVWLLGISHASYLAYKAAPHTTSAGAHPHVHAAAPQPAPVPAVPPPALGTPAQGV